MPIEWTNSWDEAFFTEFVALRNRIYQKRKLYLEETVSDLFKLWEPSSDFAKNQRWRAGISYDSNGEAQARLLVS